MANSLALVLALLGTSACTALAPRPSSVLARSRVRVHSEASEAAEPVAAVADEAVPEAVEEPVVTLPAEPRKSMALPFMMAPTVLDGSMAGDFGFDPLGFADSPENLMLYREAEIKHARLAMLAAAGWPIAELVQPDLAKNFGLPSLLANEARSPSVLNGGLGQTPVLLFVLAAFATIGFVEGTTLNQQYISPSNFEDRPKVFATKKEMGVKPGIFGFDPFNLYQFFGADEFGKFEMETAEIKNGRLAMLGITGFAVQEAVFHTPVVSQTPLFFTPFFKVVADAMMKY